MRFTQSLEDETGRGTVSGGNPHTDRAALARLPYLAGYDSAGLGVTNVCHGVVLLNCSSVEEVYF